jgi:hypothetical protein
MEQGLDRSADSSLPISPSAQQIRFASPWSNTGSETPSPFTTHMADLLGCDAEPDPLFFVETWTIGLDAATHNLHTRRHASDARDPHAHEPQSFHFFTPVTFVDVAVSASGSTMPASFSSAWKDAYGTPASPTGADAPHESAPPHAPGLSQTLTAELACRTLGIAPSSSRKQIKTAYRQLVWRYHPDRLEHSSEHDQRAATDRMISINAAYHLLCDAAPTAN